MNGRLVTWMVAALALVLAGGYYGWRSLDGRSPVGIASGNGRLEAVEIDVAAKTAGRIREILVDEGQFVKAGDVVARMDTAVLEAQRREAEAQRRRAQIEVRTTLSLVAQREAEKASAIAVIRQREADLDAAQRRLVRTEELAARGNAPAQTLDDDRARVHGQQAAVAAARAQLAGAEAAHATAEAAVIGAEAAVEAAAATIDRIQADIDDSALRAPRDGRVQYRIAQSGEVLAAGGRVLNLVDLGDVYMTFFLPTAAAGRVAIGSEVRLVLDAAPELVIPAKASFVAAVAQFTPKTVETTEERQKLMFRVKARIDPDLLRKHADQVKTGLPGRAHVRTDPAVAWPKALEIRLPR